ncbi:exosporium glycoprotein BclB-related protein [Dyadobacter pollutisoli]|uniref:BclB C-terminal domain-containing protein n=1 Tax=Dyadobacter pollutisoli TaxID=2910158 RepID=A0A9E8NA18_9BACT|nr:exosporium glycoprotein BclB-related protein [Dyadobacter pollutisoli]WAC12760.1 hypothetical protein ON006_02095 [Dyadobacter pollutisoli]
MKNIYLSNVRGPFQKVKRAILIIFFALFALTVHAQVGIGTITPHASAQLEIQAVNKGLLIPRMTEAARTLLIPSPATGLLVYQTDGVAPGFYYFDGLAWQPLKAPASSGGGAIIPYASGNAPIVMTTLLGGFAGTGAAIGFGDNLAGLSTAIPFLDGALLPGNMAFSVPRAGVVSSISATFVSTVAVALFGTATVKAQLYSALAGTDMFLPLPGVEVSLPPFAAIAIGSIGQATLSGLAIPVVAGDRLLLVFSCSEAGGLIPSNFVGHASAGVEIK